ncbi:Arylsulfatase [Arcticibacter svalbardensis MN12-7]|uniref:Arylsulfatase n=1 Tax=Arcticibacter svalbardensis MN12-7 TaxID=1150600 RepID=R9H069_9SPHI|nr:arylsulfatase [Arcticibacter svalbardensis]EOR94614.1 Arylsulfatase [Arcticibacter svalbardensis MN12-7]
MGLILLIFGKGDFKKEPRETILYYFGVNNLNGVRKGNWKLVLPHKWGSYNTQPGNDGDMGKKISMAVEKAQLYDMSRDPGERYNVSDTYPDKVKELMLVVDKAREEMGDLNVGFAKCSGSRDSGKVKK